MNLKQMSYQRCSLGSLGINGIGKNPPSIKKCAFLQMNLFEIAQDESEDVPNKYQNLINTFLSTRPKDDQDLFIKEVTKMHLYGMTYREIRDNTGICLDTIHKTIKKFKYDLYNYSGGDCESIDVLPAAEH
jgi:hypothetical protein